MFSLLYVTCFSHLNSFLLFTSSQPLPLLIMEETGQNQPVHTSAYPCLPSSQSWSQTFWPCTDSLQCACSGRWQNSPQKGREGAQGKKTLCEATVAGRQATGHQRTCNLFLCWCILVVVSHCYRLLATGHKPSTSVDIRFCTEAWSQRKL